jgi:hypothetical protein
MNVAYRAPQNQKSTVTELTVPERTVPERTVPPAKPAPYHLQLLADPERPVVRVG